MYASNAEAADELEARKIATRIGHNKVLIYPRSYAKQKGLWQEIIEGDGIVIVAVIVLNAILFWWVMSKKKDNGYSAVAGVDDVQLRKINRERQADAV